MPVLLMARGDKEARELLKRAVEARYGPRPPVIESLTIDFTGRVRTKIGPISTWVPLDVRAQFRLPDAMRWDFTAKPAGVPMHRGVEAYDGQILRTMRSGNVISVTDSVYVESFQKRLWAIAALLLMPLSDHFVNLTTVNELTFSAENTQMNVAVQVHLQDTDWVDAVIVDCFNADKNAVQRFSLRAEPEQVSFDDLLLPKKISAFWDDNPWFEVVPIAATNNPEILDREFTLGVGDV